MKKSKMMKRIVALTLAMILMSSMVMSVCARGNGSYSWVSNGNLYTASVSVNNSSTGSTSAYSTATTKYHYQGATDTITAPAGTTVYKSWSNTFPAAYRTYLNNAMSNAGYPVNASFAFPYSVSVTINSNAATGNYAVSAGILTYSGSWWITGESAASITEPMAESPQATVNSGSMSNVPGALSGYYTYVRVGN